MYVVDSFIYLCEEYLIYLLYFIYFIVFEFFRSYLLYYWFMMKFRFEFLNIKLLWIVLIICILNLWILKKMVKWDGVKVYWFNNEIYLLLNFFLMNWNSFWNYDF